ncbi:MAG: sel1 repeat family protein [Thiogranum sp.]|nr:sel1 repeat family protein [Thiogranum sp.]
MDEDHPELQRAIAALKEGRFDRSFEIVSRQAHTGASVAQHFLGWLYHKGIGTAQDDAQAAFWWRSAAEQGLPEAQQGLGWAYANGKGVEEDAAEAYRWYRRAADAGDETARQGLVETAQRLTAEQLRALEAE